VVHAWPKKWSLSDLDAEQSGIAIETLELHYRTFSINT
jgi:phage tail-like protein